VPRHKQALFDLLQHHKAAKCVPILIPKCCRMSSPFSNPQPPLTVGLGQDQALVGQLLNLAAGHNMRLV
jgi:hypothetical protein